MVRSETWIKTAKLHSFEIVWFVMRTQTSKLHSFRMLWRASQTVKLHPFEILCAYAQRISKGWSFTVCDAHSLTVSRYMVTKREGLRVFWDGLKLLTKYGSVLYPPRWFKTHLPSSSFEATMHGNFPSTENQWKYVKLFAFESPLMYSSSWEDRLENLRSSILCTSSSPYIRIHCNR